MVETLNDCAKVLGLTDRFVLFVSCVVSLVCPMAARDFFRFNPFPDVVAQEGRNPSTQITVDFSLPAAPQSAKLITVDDVIKLSKGEITEDVIIMQIRKRAQPFDLTPDQLLQLKAARVSDRVIEAMTGTNPAQMQPVPKVVDHPSGAQPPPGAADASTRNDGLHPPRWEPTVKSDPLTGTTYTAFILVGKYLTAPSRGSAPAPIISLRCDPTPHHRMSGRLIAGFIDVGTVIDLENGHGDFTTVKYRLDDGKVQPTTHYEVGNSTNYEAIAIKDIFLDNLLWGHLIPHKPHSSQQVHKAVISVQEHLDGDVVMQFDMPDAQEVGAACGTEYKN